MLRKVLVWALGPWLVVGPAAATTITVLHNNDGESRLLSPVDADGRGSLEAFVATLRAARAIALGQSDAVITLSSGDNILAGPAFQTSLDSGRPGERRFYDAQALALIDYDAIALGNHDFDFGPGILAELIPAVVDADGRPVPFLSSNLGFATDSPLRPHVDSGQLRSSVVLEPNGIAIGVIGGVTEDLARISNAGAGTTIEPLVPSLQAEIDRLDEAGVDRIVVISHVQSIQSDIDDVIPNLRGVDIYVAGGGDELLTAGTLVDADGDDVYGQTRFGAYPQIAEDADGRSVVVVTTPGAYRYVGMLTVRFDDEGELEAATGGTIVADPAVFGTALDAAALTGEVQVAFDALAAKEIGVSEVPLNGVRADVRTQATNLGALIADALAAEARRSFADRIDDPLVAFQNGGGIRNDSVMLAAAEADTPLAFTELLAFEAVPFPNFVALVEDLDAASLKETLEHAVGAVESMRGQFLQVAGLSYAFDAARPAGERVLEITLDDGTAVVRDGEIVAEVVVDVATVDFLARGGDGFDTFADREVHRTTTSQQQALARFIGEDLGGRINAERYSEEAVARIVAR